MKFINVFAQLLAFTVLSVGAAAEAPQEFPFYRKFGS